MSVETLEAIWIPLDSVSSIHRMTDNVVFARRMVPAARIHEYLPPPLNRQLPSQALEHADIWNRGYFIQPASVSLRFAIFRSAEMGDASYGAGPSGAGPCAAGPNSMMCPDEVVQDIDQVRADKLKWIEVFHAILQSQSQSSAADSDHGEQQVCGIVEF